MNRGRHIPTTLENQRTYRGIYELGAAYRGAGLFLCLCQKEVFILGKEFMYPI